MRSALVLLAIAVAFFASAPAEAGLKACNKTNRNADVAIAQGVSYTSWQGTYDPSKVFIKKDITVQSRVSLSANSCKVLADTGVANQGDEKSPSFIWYVYARTQNGEWTSGG